MKSRYIAALLAWLLVAPLVFSGCPATSGEGFALYLTRDNTPVAQMASLSHFSLATAPLISLNDIISYDKTTHEIELTPAAYRRIDTLEVPTSGKSFVVSGDKKPVYWGAFWTPVSSQSFSGVAIWVNLSAEKSNIIKLALGYPSPAFFQGEDPRSNAELMRSLEKAGKFK